MDCGVTREELACLSAGDLTPERARAVRTHVATCGACRSQLEAIERLDAALALLPHAEPPSSALLNVRRAVSQELRGSGAPEVMTLDEAAAFLRISLDDLEELILELPAFELAGQLRIRRSRLIEWVTARERAYSLASAQSEVAHILAES